MPKYDHHFLPLDPPPANAEECAELQVLEFFQFKTLDGVEAVVRFLGPPHRVAVIAATFPSGATKHPDGKRWFDHIFETSIAVIRLTHDAEAMPFTTAQGFMTLMTQTDDEEPDYRVHIGTRANPNFRVNGKQLVGTFAALYGPVKSDVAILVAEASVPTLPPHYADLSLIRAMELLWPNERDRAAALAPWEGEFKKLNMSPREFRKALPEIRNRCAHGKGRGNAEPFRGIGYNAGLYPLKCLLHAIVLRGLRDHFGIPITEGALIPKMEMIPGMPPWQKG